MKRLRRTYTSLVSRAITEGVDSSMIEDLGEAVIDSGISNEILEELPFVKMGKAIIKVGRGFNDNFYIKKFLFFFTPSNQKASAEERKKFVQKISTNEKIRNRIYERILVSLDRIDDAEKAEILGILFLSVIQDRVSINEYIRMAWAVENLRLDDLKYFLIKNRKQSVNEEDTNFENDYYSSVGSDFNNQETFRVGLQAEVVKVKKARYDGGSEFEKEYSLSTLGHNFLKIYWSNID